MQISNKLYNYLKPIALIWLPALSTLYLSLADLWHLGYKVEISGTIMAIDTFLGVVLGLSSSAYYKSDRPYDGTLEVSKVDSSQIHQLEISTPPEDLQTQDQVTFRVNRVDGSN